MQKILDQDTRTFEPRKSWNKKVSFVDEAENSDCDEEPVIGLAEWVKNKKPLSYPFGQKELEKFAFDITKADRIFYLISCFRRGRLNYHLIMQFHRRRS